MILFPTFTLNHTGGVAAQSLSFYWSFVRLARKHKTTNQVLRFSRNSGFKALHVRLISDPTIPQAWAWAWAWCLFVSVLAPATDHILLLIHWQQGGGFSAPLTLTLKTYQRSSGPWSLPCCWASGFLTFKVSLLRTYGGAKGSELPWEWHKLPWKPILKHLGGALKYCPFLGHRLKTLDFLCRQDPEIIIKKNMFICFT